MPEQTATARRTPTRHAVARLDDLAHGAILLVEVGGREIGLVRWRDEVFAVRNVCPHVAGPACGLVRAKLTADATQQRLVVHEDSPMLVCAWHKWEFDLHDHGKALLDPKLRVRTYPVVVDADGTVWLTV